MVRDTGIELPSQRLSVKSIYLREYVNEQVI